MKRQEAEGAKSIQTERNLTVIGRIARCRHFWNFLPLVTMLSVNLAIGSEGATVDERFPHLATGILKSSSMANLKEGVVLTAGDIRITGDEIKESVSNANRKIRSQLKKNLFYVLEKKATEKLVAREAYKAGYGKTKREDRVVKAFLQHKFSGMKVSDNEAKAFYEENEATIGVPFEQVKDVITSYVVQEKTDEAIKNYIAKLGRDTDIRVDSKWVGKQYILAKDNPVDQARNSGKPTMIEFGATGCKACDMMQPILKNLRNKYKDKLNVLFVHVREDQILAARYGIVSIPVQVFFDKTGKEFFRHVGFFPQTEVEKKILEMGGSIDEKSG